MKKCLALLAFTIIGLISYSQIIVTATGGPVPQFQQVGSATSIYHINGMAYSHLGLINGRYADTTAANAAPYIKWWSGAQIVVGNKIYLRSYPNADSWIEIGSGGGVGTVTSFSSGNLSPLFTTSVATSTSTPALSFSLSNAAAYTLYGRASGVGVPSFLSSIDSNWVLGLHTENYYNTKYLGINSGWSLTGNAATTPASNFVGTTDAQDLVFKRNSVETWRMGATSHTSTLDIKLNNATVAHPVIEVYDAQYLAQLYKQGLAFFTTSAISGTQQGQGLAFYHAPNYPSGPYNVVCGMNSHIVNNDVHFALMDQTNTVQNADGSYYNRKITIEKLGNPYFQCFNNPVGNNPNVLIGLSTEWLVTGWEGYRLAVGGKSSFKDRVYIQDTLGIGTQTPAAILHTVGTLRFAGISEGAGKVLTSDADGDATWQTPTGGGGSADSTWVDVKNYFTAGVELSTSTRQQRIDAWQAAIADAQTKQYGIKFSGAWDVRTDSLIITNKLVIQGVGNGSSLTTTDNTGTLLTIDITTTRNYYSVIFPTYKPVVLQDFQVRYLGVSDPDATSIGIKNTCTASFNFQQRYERITVDSFYTGIKHHNIASSHIYECYFRNNRAFGFLNTNDESQDYGKMVIDKCVFSVSAGIAGQPDTSAHIKWEGGAGLTVTNCDLYGGVDEGVWVNLQNTTEAFASAGSTEYSFKDNRVLFVNDYAFLFDTDFGKGGSGTAFDGNKIQDIQIQNNMTGINGLLKTVGGTASIFDVQVTGNTNIYPYLSTAKIPIVINGLAMTNYMMSGNVFNGVLFSTGTTFPGITTAVDVTGGAISGITNACSNQYIGYGTPPDVPDICASPGSWTTNTGTVATLNQASTLAMAGNTFNFSGGNVGIGRTPAVNLDILGASNTYVRATRPNNVNDLFTILVPNGALASGNSQYAFGMAGGSANFTLQQYNGTTAYDVISANESTQAITLSSLAGTGSRTVLADASGVLSAPVSDRSVKENIKGVNSAIGKIMRLRPVTFEYKDGWKNYGNGTQIGFIAQEVASVLPNSVFTTPSTGKMGYNETDIIPLLVKGMQEQQKLIEELQKEIIKLKRK